MCAGCVWTRGAYTQCYVRLADGVVRRHDECVRALTASIHTIASASVAIEKASSNLGQVDKNMQPKNVRWTAL